MSETRENPPVPAPVMRAADDVDDQISLNVSRPAPDQVVLEIGGEFDMLTSPQLRAAALAQFAPEAGVDLLVLSLDDVTFLGTSGLAVLIEVRDAAHAAGIGLRLACTARRVMRPLAIAGLVPLFDIYPTVDEAIAAS